MANNLPGIFLNTMPKSGSLYIWQALEYGLYVPPCRVSHSTFPGDIIVPEWLERLRCGNVVTQEHIPASLENLAAMSQAEIYKIILHVRDPRQATVSWMHHIIKRWVDNPGEELEPDKLMQFCSLSVVEKIDILLNDHYISLIDWLKGWYNVCRANNRFGIKVHFTSFESFKENQKEYFWRILDFYEIDRTAFNFSVLKEPEKDVNHFRKGETDEWRRVFTPQQQAKAAELMPDELAELFHWEKN